MTVRWLCLISDAPPLLLVASAHDPVTRIEGARRLRRYLPGSRLVTLDNDYSHGVFAGRGNACVDHAVAAYLVDGTVPTADVRAVRGRACLRFRDTPKFLKSVFI